MAWGIWNRQRMTWVLALCAGALLAGCDNGTGAAVTAKAATSGMSGISFTLQGCRNNGDVALPDGSGRFICPDDHYTSGNLGKGWNELDLVPYRLTVTGGHAAPALQAFSIAIALDNRDGDAPGYDVISAPVLNAALSAASCIDAASAAQATMAPGVGGIDITIYRLLSLQQARDTTCVYDYYGRLALGSHLFPGSSLHANVLNDELDTGGIGARDVSIPVREILPQEIAKTMSATQGASQTWGVSKTGPAGASFGDVCAEGGPQPQQVQITVTWSQLEIIPGSITAVANIYATNPASRTITVAVTDELYDGPSAAQGSLLNTTTFDPVDVPAGTTALVGTDTVTVPATTSAIGHYLSDVAHATYTDLVTGIEVPGQASAIAETQIQSGTIANTTAAITDEEAITGDGLTFSADPPAIGGFTNGYDGTPTTGPLGWASGLQGTTGSTTFTKTLYLAAPWITSGVLSDQASLVASDGFTAQSNRFEINVSSTASVALTVRKSIPDWFLLEGHTATVTFHVTRAHDPTYGQDVTLTLDAYQPVQATTLTGLVPDLYTVAEGAMVYSLPVYPTLVPEEGLSQSVDLMVPSTGSDPFEHCSGTVAFSNVLPDSSLASAQVQKITYPALSSSDPDYSWTFRLTGPGAIDESVTADAGAGYVAFASRLLRAGTYTVTETAKADWDKTSPAGNCTFTVSYPASAGVLYSCDFVNTRRAHADVVKTVSGAAPGGSQSFTFQLRQNATPTSTGTTLETQPATAANGGAFAFATSLIPGQTYQVCEIVMPGWQTTLGTFVPDSFVPPDGIALNPTVDNSIVCGNFTPQPGQTVSFTVDNTPPPGGRALTIGFWKNWASCTNSSTKKRPVLDEVLATFPVEAGQARAGVWFGALYVDTCNEAVALLNKSTLNGKKMASDPAFNMAAQLMAADLNVRAGAGFCPAVTTAISQAHALLAKYAFNGVAKPVVSAADAALMNTLANTLDRYNNNLFCS